VSEGRKAGNTGGEGKRTFSVDEKPRKEGRRIESAAGDDFPKCGECKSVNRDIGKRGEDLPWPWKE